MFRFIKIIINAFILVLAIIGFNAIGGQKYVEAIKVNVTNFIQQRAEENAKKIGDFSNLHKEFQIDNTVNLLGYKAIIAEHSASGQKMCIVDSGSKPLLSQSDIKNEGLENKLKDLSKKFKYQALSFEELKITSRGTLSAYGQTVPYAKFEAKVSKLPFSNVAGIVASIKTSDGAEKLAISVNENSKYSQLIADEFFKGVKEN